MTEPGPDAVNVATAGDDLALGRTAFARRAWKEAYVHLCRADEAAQLAADDLERLALAAYAINLQTEPFRAWTRAHHEWLRQGAQRRAARCAFQQACALYQRGEMAPAQGWVARGRRIVERLEEEGPEHGWLLELTGLPLMFQGDNRGALAYFMRAHEIAQRFDDVELTVTIGQTLGHVLIQLNDLERGLALVDESMVAVTSGEVDPLFAGIAYCQLIQTCQDIFDLRRAREWTESLARWCDAQPDLVPYRGDCLIYRCEMLTLLGAWPDAEAVAAEACETLAAQRAWAALGSAHYQLAEIYRLRGDHPAAEEQYLRAGEYGRDPEPGSSLLRLSQGRLDAARQGIERALSAATRPASRARFLPAYVEIMLACGRGDAAAQAADELGGIARELDTPFLRGLHACATGAVLLARGDPAAALDLLKDACRIFTELDAPYEAARSRLLAGRASKDLGDGEAAAREFDAARAILARLGATADLARIDALTLPAQPVPGGLSARELEVLALIARGLTNKQISVELVVSENTVARHVQNIFAKLGVSSRTAATAFAFEHGLV